MFTIATFYRFADITDPRGLQAVIRTGCAARGVRGTVVVAPEGINGTIAGADADVRAVITLITAQTGLEDIAPHWSTANDDPFVRLKVRIKREIVSLGVGIVDVPELTAKHVGPSEWHRLLDRDDVVVIDARNAYETEIGTFPGAIDPRTRSFTDFPAWVDAQPALAVRPPVAMFCTGGIRCEKASAWLRSRGFDEIYQLDGGILNYLDQVPADRSRWSGECYVFDHRVSVRHDLTPGTNEVCPNCNRVVSEAERDTPGYATGVCCPACHETIPKGRRARFEERQRQMELAAARGVGHLGSPP